ncbi:MAG: polyhydroxyalkanoate synthesis repressor PhaR [Dongiaceae bacterium]
MADRKASIPQVVIKKYANRRLYNTSTSTYVTLEDLCQMVKDGIDFGVYDAKTGDDLTRGVLTQIIVEQEGKGSHLLPTPFLKQLIGFYGDSMQGVVPRYLEHSLRNFANNQEQLRKYLNDTLGGLFPFGGLGEIGKQNMALIEKGLKMFMPFSEGGMPPFHSPAAKGGEEDIDRLKMQLDDLQKQFNHLSRKKS